MNKWELGSRNLYDPYLSNSWYYPMDQSLNVTLAPFPYNSFVLPITQSVLDYEPKQYRDILIGVANVILNESGEILVSRRLEAAKLGIGKLATPGGCLEENEKIEDCSKREVLEETGLKVQPFEIDGSLVFHTVEYFHGEGVHNLTLYVASRVTGGELCNNEPLKHTDWTWVTPQQLETLSAPSDDWIPVRKLKLLRESGKI